MIACLIGVVVVGEEEIVIGELVIDVMGEDVVGDETVVIVTFVIIFLMFGVEVEDGEMIVLIVSW